jgi:hypothetical protein
VLVMDDTEVPKKRWGSTLRLLLLLVVLVAGFAGYMRYVANQRAGGQQVYDNLAVFDTRLQNLENSIVLHEKRIKDLEDAAQKTGSAPQSPAPMATAGAGDDRIAALEKEIATLKAASPMQDSDKIVKSIRLLSTFHRLSDRVIGGKPFAAELTAFEEAASPDESAGAPLSTLAPYADGGIPTFATLLVTFDQSIESLNAAEAVPPANAGLWERFKYNLSHIVTVRRIDEAQAGNSADAIVGRAQAHLEREEIEAAVAEIKSLPESVRGNFAGWLDDAQIVTEAPSLVDQIEEQVLQKAFSAQPSVPVQAPAPAQPAPAQPPAPPAPSPPATRQAPAPDAPDSAPDDASPSTPKT